MKHLAISQTTIFSLTSLLIVALVVPLLVLHFGILQVLPAGTVTVVGEAETEITNQVASFTAGVAAINDDRDTAIAEVNTKVTAVIEAVKQFGIPETDIQTQSLSVYQMEEAVDVAGRQRTTPGQWRVSNDIQVKLKDIDQASELADLLSSSGATNVYGPNFRLENIGAAEIELLSQAIDNAREKAIALTTSQGKLVGEVVAVQEGFAQNTPFSFGVARDMGGSGGMPIEPGMNMVSKSVTVTFRLR